MEGNGNGNGNIYAVLLKDNILKIGQSANVVSRLKCYSGIQKSFISKKCSNLLNVERKVISELKTLGFYSHKGREYLNANYGQMKEAIETIEKIVKKNKPIEIEVIMERELFGHEIGQKISQRTKIEFFSATDLVRSGNLWRRDQKLSDFNLGMWFKKKSTLEFMESLQEKYGKIKISGRGKGKHTWVHPLLFIDIALAISPKLKIEVYGWLFDHLIKNRNDSGKSYNLMCGSLYTRHTNKSTFPNFISKVAKRIRKACEVTDWQKANEEQLKKRDKIHNDISLLSNVLRNNKQAVRMAIKQNKKGRI